MNIAFVSSEVAPFFKTGGLGDVAGELPKHIAEKGHNVKVFLPLYRGFDKFHYEVGEVFDDITVSIGQDEIKGALLKYDTGIEGLDIYFLYQPGFFNRDGLYGDENGDYPDNAKRFIWFQKAVINSVMRLKFDVDIFHCNDWQTSLIPLYIKRVYGDNPYVSSKSVMTIHNLAYQGIFDYGAFVLTGLPQDLFSLSGLEFYGKCNFLKGGILYADAITTVSKRYAEEIQLPEFGCGLDGVLRQRRDVLAGILNGIDYDKWNPETDPDVTVNYNFEELDRKYINKGVLQKENNLPVDRGVPLFGFIGRLVSQKGLDLIDVAMPELVKLDIQFVFLGVGSPSYHRKLMKYHNEYPDKVAVNLFFDEQMAKRIYAGSDIFLMPSHFEPCGLSQLISYRFCTVPLVRETGGLADTVADFNKHTGEGTGFVFSRYDSSMLIKTVNKAAVYYKDKKLWRKIVENGNKLDFSWKTSAGKYIKLYKKTANSAVGVS